MLVVVNVRRSNITLVDIHKYMDLHGAKLITRANREHAFMSAVFSWGILRKVDIRGNPYKKVNKFSEKPHTRDITDHKKGDKRLFSAHKTLARANTYNRLPKVVQTNG
jgi:hypothetical protein